MDDIGGESASSQISDELDISLSIFHSNEYGDLCTKVVDLSQLVRSITKEPTVEQLESIEYGVDDLLENLNENSKDETEENDIKNTMFDAYKILTESLLILRKHQNDDGLYRRKYEEIKKEYELQEKLHQVEIENFKKGDNASNNSYADQIEDAKNELKSIRLQFENFKKKVDKSVSSIQMMMQLPETTTIKTLKNEISIKLKDLSNEIQSSDIAREKQKNEKLLKELKNATAQCASAQTNERLKDEEIKRLSESLSLFENQIASLTKEKNDVQNSLNEIKNQNESNEFQDRLYLTQTELGSLNIKYPDLIDKLERLKKKLDKSRNENASLKDEVAQSKAVIEKLQLELQQSKLENEELQAENKANNSNQKAIEEIQAKNVEIEQMNTAIEKVVMQLSNQSQEISKMNEIKQRLIDFIQKQSEVISAFSKETSNLQTELKKKENEKNEHYQVVKNYEDEIDKYKCFINGFARLVSIHMAQETAAPVIKSLQQLRLEGLGPILANIGDSTQTSDTQINSKVTCDVKGLNENEIVKRLFQYVEDQINIIQSIASTELLGQATASNILKSCQEADEFVKSFAPSFYDEPSIFSSFGLIVHPSKLSNSLRNFLTTFNSVTSPESRELFDIAKQAIAMNSLMRSVASIIRNENSRVYDEMQKTVENMSELRRSDSSDAESRISETEKLLTKAVAQKENSARKLEELKSTLKKMMEKGFALPQKITDDLDNDGSFYIDSSEIEPPNFQESDIGYYQKEDEDQQFENIEFLKDKLAKSQNKVKVLKKKIEFLLKKFEKLRKKSLLIPKLEEEKETLKTNLEQISSEYENYKVEMKNKFDEMKELMKQKLEDQQQATINDATSQIDRIRSEYKNQMKQKNLEMKEKLKKAIKQCENQTQRADVLKMHYESVLQNLREKLSKSRETENQAKNAASEAEIEVNKFKSKISSLMVDNKMLNLRLSSFEEKTKFDNSFVENQAKVKKLAADSRMEEKMNEIERRDNEFIIKVAEYLKQCSSSYNNIDSFEKIEYCIQNIASQISELNSKMQKMTEFQSEMNKIRSFLMADPNISTYSAVCDKIEQLNSKIYELKKDNSDVWRNWAIQIIGTKESDELLMNDIELLIKQNQMNSQSKQQDTSNSTNEPYVKSLIGAMESMGKRTGYPKKVYPLSSQV